MSHGRLLDIAIGEFGAKGLDGASTRGIAAAAGTAMSAITYHFGGKEGLYLAAADHIAERMAKDIGAAVEAEGAIGRSDPLAATAGIHRILARLADKMGGTEIGDWSLFIQREQMNPGAAFDRIYDGAMGAVLETLVELVCVATGRPERRAARIVTITLTGQVMALRGSRATCLRLFGHDSIEPGDLAEIKARIAANTDAILAQMRAESQGTS